MKQYATGPLDVDSGRARKVVSERADAVRRWIDDEDEPAVRGID